MKYFLFSLGCKVNAYEISALRETLRQRGDEEVFEPAQADLIVLNTCAVTGTAEQKSRQHIRKFRRAAPKATLLVMGCHSELHAAEASSMGADIVLGTANRSEALACVEAFQASRQPIIAAEKGWPRGYEEMGPMAFSDNVRAYLKIQDGCDNRCAYCLIPSLRGPSRSRLPQNALREAERLVGAGYKEIVIAGIHIGFYGKDLGDGSYRLADLLRDLLRGNPTLYRLRISSLEESEIDDRFLSVLHDFPNVADHLHIPLQSGSSAVLRRMRRKYDTAAFLGTLGRIRAIRPDIAITTDVIAGFPGETEEEWAETMAFCAQAAFAEIHVFPYSRREGTAAASLQETDPRVKDRRVQELLALSRRLRAEYEERFLGKPLEVLFEEDDAAAQRSYGHTSNYLLVGAASPLPLRGTAKTVIYDEKTKAD